MARTGAPVCTASPARPSGWTSFSHRGFSGARTSHIRISPFMLQFKLSVGDLYGYTSSTITSWTREGLTFR